MQTKRLLVNADDFGLTEGITDGIIQAHRSGIVTSTSIVAGGAAFEHAAKQALSNSSLGIGIHLTLVEEQAVSHPEDIPTLVKADGRLPASYSDLLSALVHGRIRLEHVEHEMRAQIVKCLAAGLKPTHLDSHQHVHALPSILRMVVRLAEEFNIRGMRLPRDSPRLSAVFARGGSQKTMLCMLARWDAHYVRDKPLTICDRMAGLFESGALHETELLAILEHLPGGTTELVCHPGISDSESRATYAHWRYDWNAELHALTSHVVRERLLAKNIELVSYRDLQESRKNLPSPMNSAGPVR